MFMPTRIESLLSARLFVAPQLVDERIYFISNLGGQLSLYAMNYGGSVPEPLLPPHLALQNPHLIGGYSFYVFNDLGKILVMLDNDGDENYQPMLIPLEGGFPEPAFDNFFANHRVHMGDVDAEKGILYFSAERRDKSINEAYRGNLFTNELTKLGESAWGAYPSAHSPDHKQVILSDGYSVGDIVLYLVEGEKRTLLYGKPIEKRQPGEIVAPSGINTTLFAPSGKGLLLASALFEDTYSPGYLSLDKPGEILPVKVRGARA
jgi:hypothetical protein